MATQLEEPRVTPFQMLGGRDVIARIVDRFYDLMDTDPAYTKLRAMHPDDLGPMRHSLTGFLTAWTGGPQDWHSENPGKCMMSAHKGFTIDAEGAEQWSDAMKRAIGDTAPEDQKIADMFAERLDMIAKAMAGRT